MQEISYPVIRQTTLDFSASGQRPAHVSQLVQDEHVIFNAIELIDWENDRVQALICGQCGIVGCASGGWISFRSAGTMILFTPASDEDFESARQPLYFISGSTYDQLQDLIPQLPPRPGIIPLTTREAVRLLQFEAPYNLFGSPFTEFSVRRDLVIGASSGSVTECLNQIQTLIHTCSSTDANVLLRPSHGDEEIVSLYVDYNDLSVDYHDFVEWNVLACTEESCRLIVGSQLVLDIEPRS
jgi:hypothetical protein